MQCSCPNLSGYWKGVRCSNAAKFQHDGKGYCSTHLTAVIHTPDRVEKVKRQWEKAEKNLGNVRVWDEVFNKA